MRSNYTLLHLLVSCLLMFSFPVAQAQLYVGNGGDVYISSGEQLFIKGDLVVDSGAIITNKSSAGFNLTGIANLNGTLEYAALGSQLILPFNHQILRISGTGNKMLSSGIVISTNLQLGGTAKLITGNHILSLSGTGSTISGAPSFGSNAGSWIVTGTGGSGAANTGSGGLKISSIGAMGRMGQVLFPLGPTTTSYLPLTVTNTGTTDDFAVTVNDQVVPGAPVNESVQATWNISESTPGGSMVTLGAQWNASDEAASFIRSVCSIVHSNGTVIDYFASAGAASGTNPFTQTGNGFTVFSPFGITSNATVLPVNFLSVKGYRKGAFVMVDWEVAAETAIRSYEVQKSGNGSNFSTAGQIGATGNGNNHQSYSWPDRTPSQGVNFYRIRSVGLNGSYKYSSIVKVDYVKNEQSFNAYPNPVVNNQFSLEFQNQAAGNYTLKIISLSGQVVYEKVIVHNGTNGSHAVHLPADLSRSIYQMNIEGPDGSNTLLKLMIHR